MAAILILLAGFAAWTWLGLREDVELWKRAEARRRARVRHAHPAE